MQLVRNELQKLYKDAYDKLEFPISDRRKLYQQQQEAAKIAAQGRQAGANSRR
jgi:hypothetical protein